MWIRLLGKPRVGAFAVPAFGPVEGVVATAYGYEVAHVYRAAEELKAIVGTFVGLAVVHDGTVAYAVERDTVGFVLFIEGKAGVFQTNVLQRARVVGIIVAAVNGTAYFRTSLATFGIGVGASADVDASPCARLFFSLVITMGLSGVPTALILPPCFTRM